LEFVEFQQNAKVNYNQITCSNCEFGWTMTAFPEIPDALVIWSCDS